jgi:hypothetical protein
MTDDFLQDTELLYNLCVSMIELGIHHHHPDDFRQHFEQIQDDLAYFDLMDFQDDSVDEIENFVARVLDVSS